MAQACLVLGIVALSIALAALADVPNRLPPRTISRIVEEERTGQAFLIAMTVGLTSLATGQFGREAATRHRGVGQLCSWMTLALFVTHTLSVAGDSRNAARRSQCVNNLKQIGIALQAYEITEGTFPPRAICDPKGRPLLSWRVAILPFIEQRDLYAKFHLNEPWNSPHNLRLAEQIPACYVCPTQAGWTGKMTLYQALDGPGTFLDGTTPTRASDVTDGLAATIAVLEAPSLVPWTSPQDCPFRSDRPFRPWSVTHPGGICALMCDGSVRFVMKGTPEEDFKAAATKSAGEGQGAGTKRLDRSSRDDGHFHGSRSRRLETKVDIRIPAFDPYRPSELNRCKGSSVRLQAIRAFGEGLRD